MQDITRETAEAAAAGMGAAARLQQGMAAMGCAASPLACGTDVIGDYYKE